MAIRKLSRIGDGETAFASVIRRTPCRSRLIAGALGVYVSC